MAAVSRAAIVPYGFGGIMAQEVEGQRQFSALRRIFFPIHNYELKKVVPMAFIFFFILTIYSLLRNAKDTLVVTAPNSGAEVLSFLKLFCVTPAAVIFLVVYAKASNVLVSEKLFYATILPFILFFGIFGFVIYPHLSYFHPSVESVAAWQEAMPRYRWLIAICGNWTYALFYVLAELWGSAIISLSFWQFANQITRVSEAKRHYAFFGLMAQTALLLSGTIGESAAKASSASGDAWGSSLRLLMAMVVIFGVMIMAIYRWMQKNVLTDKRFYDPGAVKGGSKKKLTMSMGQSFKAIFTSPYLGLIALLIVCYGVSINFVEGVWKSQVKLRYQNPSAYNLFMSRLTIVNGFVSMAMMFVGGNILRLFRWFTAAVITPSILLLLGGAFFAFVLLKSSIEGFLFSVGVSSLALAVLFGAAVNIIVKSTKYALFDLTKEMAYIPLDDEMKVKGKAVVDVLGGRLGKSGGAGFQTVLFLLMPGASYFNIAPIVAVAFLVICAIWILAVKFLGVRIDASAQERKDAEAAAKASGSVAA
ncbi:MAG: NTP/NDP exchange transporter [Puniceicoccales bacterium]|jgi:AAA family ATP:ADP antiporter|nr:NTP/NDP exchange transporter [Puniceicoccales bacterium]